MLIFFFSSCLFVGENFYSTNNISFINFSFSFQFHFSPSSLCSFRSLLLLLNFLEIFIMVFILLVKKLADFDTVPAIFRYKLNYHLISEPFDIKSWMFKGGFRTHVIFLYMNMDPTYACLFSKAFLLFLLLFFLKTIPFFTFFWDFLRLSTKS